MQMKPKRAQSSFHFLFFDMMKSYHDDHNTDIISTCNHVEWTFTSFPINKNLPQEQQFTPSKGQCTRLLSSALQLIHLRTIYCSKNDEMRNPLAYILHAQTILELSKK